MQIMEEGISGAESLLRGRYQKKMVTEKPTINRY